MPDWRCTYRLQLTPAFGFRAAREIAVPYVAELGASHLYLSPSLQARHGSLHGYDVTDPTRISADLGGEDEFRSLCTATHDAGLGILLDIVPNHMATSEQENPFWRDPALRAKFFDWDPETGWYRRFFDIGDLAGVRVEAPDVFETTHAKVLELVRDGLVDGLRIDHPDGLANPREYLDRLRDRGAQHVWVEKILERGEELREWPVRGTTGYEFANDVTALFVDPAGEEPMTVLYQELTGERRTFAKVAHEAKLEVARTTFAQELDRLRALYPHDALEEAAAALHVYRTYIEPHESRVAPEDRTANQPLPSDLRDVLELRGERSPQRDEFVTRWQQTTGPVMAKGVEDTAFYRYHRLTALNEVGGDPGRFSIDPATFHALAQARQERHPLWLLASQTHDTKRAGDVRARIGALAGMHDRWADRVRTWRDITGGLEDPNDEYLVWQTLVGAWPIIPTRLEQYLLKALREAKRHTNWVEPNDAYEQRVMRFVRSLYENQEFLDEFEPFMQDVAAAGEHASLGALLLRLTSPGLPDLYQGDEFWSLNLVDPDNRRPIDWARRYRARDQETPTRETMKFHLVRRVLRVRATHADAFAGTYEPLDLGPDRVGFIRGGKIRVVVPLRPGDSATSDRDLLLEFPQELSLLR